MKRVPERGCACRQCPGWPGQEGSPLLHRCSEAVLTQNLMVSKVWPRHLYTAKQETLCGVVFATSLAEGDAIRISQKEGLFVLAFSHFAREKPHFAL